MSFLNPWVALGIAAVVIPALIILYFLKLRRREQTVPSTLLWRRAVQDLRVNAPFQRLRKNLLLLLQLLVLAAGVTALARPIIQTSVSNESRVVILIDRSASMNAREGNQTRLELAKEQAVRLVKTFNRTGSRWLLFFGGAPAQTRVMVIAFAERAQVIAPFTTNTGELVQLIERIEPTDGGTNLAEALALAETYMVQTTQEQTPETSEQASRIVLISDGAASTADTALRTDRVSLVQVGEARDNVGVTALRTQRNYEQPEQLAVFAQIANFGPEPISADVALYVNGVLQRVEPVALGAALTRGDAAEGAASGPAAAHDSSGASLTFDLTLNTAADLEVRVVRDDALPVDNRAFAVVPPPRKLRVLLVSAGNFFLERVLDNLPLERWHHLTPQQYEIAPAGQIEAEGRSLYDVVVFDKHSTKRLPAGNYIFFAAVPQVEGVQTASTFENVPLLWWDETHPILRHVALEYVMAAKALELVLPQGSQTLVEGPRGPVLARLSREGRQYLILAFAVEESTWWRLLSFPIFMYNAITYLGGSGGAAGEAESVRPGETLRVQVPAGTESATLVRPDGGRVPLRPDTDGSARYAGTHRAGLYAVEPGEDGRNRFAVNLLDARESDIRPRSVEIGGKTVQMQEGIRTATPEIWRWFVGAALLVALLEWYIYNRRVMI